MRPEASSQVGNPQAVPGLVWWIVWGAILCGLILIYIFLGRRPSVQSGASPAALIDYVAMGPLVLSAAIRWLWFPRLDKMPQAFPIFIVGIALAEGTGTLGIFLSQQALTFTLLGALGIVQWMPLFLGRYRTDDRDTGAR